MPKRKTKGFDAKNSNVVTSPAPTRGALNNYSSDNWRMLYGKSLRHTRFSEQPEDYRVRIEGTARDSTSTERRVHIVETVYSSYHPYLALGEAVSDYMANPTVILDDIRIYKRSSARKSQTTETE